MVSDAVRTVISLSTFRATAPCVLSFDLFEVATLFFRPFRPMVDALKGRST